MICRAFFIGGDGLWMNSDIMEFKILLDRLNENGQVHFFLSHFLFNFIHKLRFERNDFVQFQTI